MSSDEEKLKKRPWAIFTIVRDEHYYLPKWYKYYSQFLPDQDLHVINHAPASNKERDTCCDFIQNKCTLYVETEEFFSSRWIRDTVEKYQKMLLEKYEAVIFTDVDEIICIHPDSNLAGLGDFMTAFIKDKKHTNWRVTAYSVIHLPDRGEKEFDFSKTIFDQRMYWFRDQTYDKPLISKIPLKYVLGHHTAANMNKALHKHLFMIHLHQFDLPWYLARHLRWAKDYTPSAEDKRNTFNSHYREKDQSKLLFNYYHHMFSQYRISPLLIERWARKLLRDIV